MKTGDCHFIYSVEIMGNRDKMSLSEMVRRITRIVRNKDKSREEILKSMYTIFMHKLMQTRFTSKSKP